MVIADECLDIDVPGVASEGITRVVKVIDSGGDVINAVLSFKGFKIVQQGSVQNEAAGWEHPSRFGKIRGCGAASEFFGFVKGEVPAPFDFFVIVGTVVGDHQGAEHFHRGTELDVLAEALGGGGVAVIELGDFSKCIFAAVKKDQIGEIRG